MTPFFAEIIGTAILIYLGNGIVANVVLKQTKGHNGGLIVIALGWAAAVMVPALKFGPVSGGLFNPALTFGLAAIGDLAWGEAFLFVIAQMIGAIVGAILVYFHYKDHFDVTEDKAAVFSCFSTSPAIRNIKSNFFSEFMGTFILVFSILGIVNTTYGDPGTLGIIGVGGIIFIIGVGLGGTTGYAINPARDLGPRIAYALLPLKHKGCPDWGYSWIPVIAPIIGGISAALVGNIWF